MAKRLKPTTITAVALCPLGANFDEETGDGAHVALYKTREATPMQQHPTTANAASVVFVNKARALYPHEPIDKAILRLAHDRPDEYRHASGQITKGTADRFTPPTASPAPGLSQAAATAKVMRIAAVAERAGALSHAQAVSLAAHVAPELASVAAGHAMIRKSGPPSEAQLEQRITAWFRTTRDAMRREADKRALEATAQQMRASFAELLNIWADQ